MTFNIERVSSEKKTIIEKAIANRPAWDSVHKPSMKIANHTEVKKGDLLYWKGDGHLGEFTGEVYISTTGYSLYGIVFHESFGEVKEGVIYTYQLLEGFYKVPYMWVDNVPIYDGMAVYGKYNDHKYTVENGWLIPEDEYAYCQILITEKTDSTAYTLQPPKKEYWVAFCGEIAIDKVDTFENVKEFVKQLGYDPKSESMKYVKVEV